MTKLDHLTVAISDHDVAMTEATQMLNMIGLREVSPDTQYAARNTAWTYKHFEDDNGFKVHVVREGDEDAKAGQPGLTHFRAVVTELNFERLRKSVYCERDADSGRIWLAGPGTLRAEIITTEGLIPDKRPEFGVEGLRDLGTLFTPGDGDPDPDADKPLHLRRHKAIMERALAIMVERDPKYHDSWKNYGWRGAMFNLRRKSERVWRYWFDRTPEREDSHSEQLDDLYDVINYATMAVQCIEDSNRDGTDGWWKAD